MLQDSRDVTPSQAVCAHCRWRLGHHHLLSPPLNFSWNFYMAPQMRPNFKIANWIILDVNSSYTSVAKANPKSSPDSRDGESISPWKWPQTRIWRGHTWNTSSCFLIHPTGILKSKGPMKWLFLFPYLTTALRLSDLKHFCSLHCYNIVIFFDLRIGTQCTNTCIFINMLIKTTQGNLLNWGKTFTLEQITFYWKPNCYTESYTVL